MMMFIKNISISNKTSSLAFMNMFRRFKFFYVKNMCFNYCNFTYCQFKFVKFSDKPVTSTILQKSLPMRYKKNFLKIYMFLTQIAKRKGGSRWRSVFWQIKTRRSKFFFFFKKKLQKHNYYQRKISKKIKYSSIVNFNLNFFKYIYVCVKIQEMFGKYRGVFRSSLGDYIVTPLINCVSYGSKINYYGNYLKFMYRVYVGSFSRLHLFKNAFLISNLGLIKPKYAVSMGTYALILYKRKKFSLISLPSKAQKVVSNKFSAYLGRNAGTLKNTQYFGKASTNYLYNKTYTTRGVAKNPVDHPNGGRTRGKNSFKTPWGLIARKNK